jgi:hypothetical protein
LVPILSFVWNSARVNTRPYIIYAIFDSSLLDMEEFTTFADDSYKPRTNKIPDMLITNKEK